MQIGQLVKLHFLMKLKPVGQKKGGLNIRVVEASVSGLKGAQDRNEAISRVAFTVPVNLPVTHTSQLHDEAERRNRDATAAMGRAKGNWP